MGGAVADWIDEEYIRCAGCGEVKNSSHFSRMDRGRLRFRSKCRSCRYTPRDFSWGRKAGYIKSSAEKNGYEFDLDAEFLEKLWLLTGGKCVYTGAGMTLRSGRNPLSLSVDRFDTLRGYTRDNVILCTARANGIKQDQTLSEMKLWMPLWYIRAKRHMKRSKDVRDN